MRLFRQGCWLLIALACSSARCDAEPLAEINIYVMPQSVVCKGGNYEEGCAGAITAAEFPALLKQATELMRPRLPQRKPLFIDQNQVRFSNELVLDSKVDDRYNEKYSVVLEIDWKGQGPNTISIERLNDIKDELFFPSPGRNPYTRDLEPGRFYYHFSFSQIYRLRMKVETKPPARQFVLAR
jgi:hypothetical protein